jgi:hypothetical protein
LTKGLNRNRKNITKMVHWTILVIGAPNNTQIEYFQKHCLSYKVVDRSCDPFDAHKLAPGYDFVLCWRAEKVFPHETAQSIADFLDFSRINVTWDSFGRNFPHKTTKLYSRDLLGFPASKHTSDELLEMQQVFILPKTLNVSAGYVESSDAVILNKFNPFVKLFDPVAKRYY